MILDTCFLIDLQRESSRRAPSHASAFIETRATLPLFISVVSIGEFADGYPDPHDIRVRGMISQFGSLDVTPDIALIFARISRALRTAGTPIGANDLWIAATALAHGLPLVTRNAAHFQRIPDLEVLGY